VTRILGVVGIVAALYAALLITTPSSRAVGNLIDVANLQGQYGIITLGAALVIIVGGIDLSIGSVVGCSAVLFGVTMKSGVHPYAAVPMVLAFGATVGLINGLLVTRLKLQAFLVTLCGMFVYRGLARLIGGTVSRTWVTDPRDPTAHPEFDTPIRNLRSGLIGKDFLGELIFPGEFVLLILLAIILGFFLHRTAYGRYWYAIGHNELAAKYAGVNVDRQRVIVYVICSTLASFGGVLLFLNSPSVQADAGGASWELFAILGAVLGGCSLRGGEGTAIGMVLGAMVMPVVDNFVNLRGMKSDGIPAVIGLTLLVGTIVDELLRRRNAARK
jgi:ribose transport system permease protein